MPANQLWSLWRSLILTLATGFTRPGQRRFVEWVTGLALTVEEHTITQSLVGLDRTGDWRALERFAEYGSWDQRLVEWELGLAIDRLPTNRWYGYRVWAGDDTTVQRTSAAVWGTCTFHEYTARCPHRAATVRAHNWVVIGGWVGASDQPATFLPVAGRLYFRRTQLPAGETFHTKCEQLVEALREQTKVSDGPHLAVFDGGFALASVVRPLTHPEAGQPRIEFVTRLRSDARLCALPPSQRRPHQRGPMPKWGPPLSPPRCGGRWPGAWQEGSVFLYGRRRLVRWKEVIGLWRVLGSDTRVKAVVADVDGYCKRFTLVTSALDLTGVHVVELFCARFRQEDGFRDLKQRLGWEECRAWTKNPIERTTQVMLVTLSVLRLLQGRLNEDVGDGWWTPPPWNPRKTRPSVLAVERLLRQHRSGIQRCLSEWLENEAKADGTAAAASPA